jgi:predicted PurR-regulated permease PerM
MSTHPVVPIGAAPTTELEPLSAPSPRRGRPATEELAAWFLLAAGILFVLVQHLVGGLVVGLALHVILEKLSGSFEKRMSRTARRPLALLIVTIITATVLALAIALTATMLRRGAGTLPDMMNQMAEILGSVRLWLGGLGQQFIPEVMTDAEDLKATIALWLKEHAKTLRAGGLWLGIGLIHMIMGSLLAVLVFFRHVTHGDNETRGPLARQLVDKVDRFADAFSRVATAQVKISAVNTTLTAIYILVILPAFGRPIPFGTTLVLITFICGLIPVLGNVISNAVITILSMGISVGTAFASLTFLVLIHKLEYLINSRIVGGETDSQAWEILMAIIVGEAAFGVGGVVLGPIIYAFIKRELRDRALV